MNDDTLNYANRIRSEMACVEKMLTLIEKDITVVEITFNNGGYGCGSTHCDYISEKEVAETKDNIIKLIRLRAQARLAELQKEFDNL